MTVTCSRLPADAVQDLALADREPDIPRFLDVLSQARAIASLRDQFPRGARIPDDPSVVYLRYKPGVSLTAAVAVQEPEPLILLQAVSVNHRPKVEKLLARQRAGATGWGVVSDPAHTLVAGVPASDRLLPGLRRRGGRATDVWVDLNDFRPLRYKPHRRWVGTGWHDGRLRVVRVVPPAAGQMCAPTLQHLDRATKSAGTCEWSVQLDTGRLRLTGHLHPREILVGRDLQVGKALVVAKVAVVLGLDVFHQPRFH